MCDYKQFKFKLLSLAEYRQDMAPFISYIAELCSKDESEILGCYDCQNRGVGFCFFSKNKEGNCTISFLKTLLKDDNTVTNALIQEIIRIMKQRNIPRITLLSKSPIPPDGFSLTRTDYNFCAERSPGDQYLRFYEKLKPIVDRLLSRGYSVIDYNHANEKHLQAIKNLYSYYYRDKYMNDLIDEKYSTIDRNISNIVLHNGKVVAFVIITKTFLGGILAYRCNAPKYSHSGAVHLALAYAIKNFLVSDYDRVQFNISNDNIDSLHFVKKNFSCIKQIRPDYEYNYTI